MTFETRAPPSELQEHRPEPPPDILDSSRLGEPEESLSASQQEGYQATSHHDYDYAADFEDDMETDAQTLTDASDDPDSLAVIRAETNSPTGDKESVNNAESSEDSDAEDSLGLVASQQKSSHAESLEFVGLANAEDNTSESDDEIGMVARAIALGDAAESEDGYNSGDLVDIGVHRDGINNDDEDEYGDDWITPQRTGSSRESRTPTQGRSAQSAIAYGNNLDDEEDDDDMLS
jgi:hypothetical protein